MKVRHIHLFALLFTFLLTPSLRAQAAGPEAEQLPLIPYPHHVERGDGALSLSRGVSVVRGGEGLLREAELLSGMMAQACGTNGRHATQVRLNIDPAMDTEEYSLRVDASGIAIDGGSEAGVFYGIQTLSQLLPVADGEPRGSVEIPFVSVRDKPQYAWRGSHIDVSRHFFDMGYLKRHIDRLAYYKMNKLHIHLTDDQGWRIEIERYPELTEKSGWREYNNHDRGCMRLAEENPDFALEPKHIRTDAEGRELYGGFFTREQMREIIRYAAERHVEIIPEVDMPGHMSAAIRVYPWLTDGTGPGWGEIFSTPLNPAKEEVYTFVENVLAELFELFPSKWFHIGADEVEKTTWAESELCRSLMEREGIETLEQLQSYFNERVRRFAESRGKTVIMWDDVLAGGIGPQTDIMYWRGWERKAPRKAAENGNHIIMTPNNELYFDYKQNKNTLRVTYGVDLERGIPEELQYLVRGAQANLWAEYVPSEARADYMLWPRLTALAERVWSGGGDFEGYSRRVVDHYPRLEAMGVNYRLPDLEGFTQECVFVDEAALRVESPLEGFVVRYTTDGSAPEADSPLLGAGLSVTESVRVRFALFSPEGKRGDVYEALYTKADYAPGAEIDRGSLTRGVACTFHEGYFKNTLCIKEEADGEMRVEGIVVPKEFVAGSFALRFRGYIDVPQTGIYSFYLNSDDASVLRIGGRTVVDNDGMHAPVEKSGQAALARGLHPFELDFVEGGGGFTLELRCAPEGGQPVPVPAEWFLSDN